MKKILFLIFITGMLFPFCKKTETGNERALFSLLYRLQTYPEEQEQSQPPAQDRVCPQSWKFRNAYLASRVVEAPGATFTGFGDPARAVNGICGCGKLCGSLDVYSLGADSNTLYCEPNKQCLVLEWEGKKVKNAPGIDFVVFENPFCYQSEENCGKKHFMEQMVVEVSLEGTNWCGWNPVYTGSESDEDLINPAKWLRFAGVEPVTFHQENWQLGEDDIFDRTKAGGDGFDLDDPEFGNSGEGCSRSLRDRIRNEGFIYLRLTAAHHRGFPGSARSLDEKKPDVDGVVAKLVESR